MTDRGSLRLPTTSTPSLPTELANAVTLWSAALGRGAPAPTATCAPAFETAAAQTDQDESKATRRTRGNSTVTELTGQVLPRIAVAPDGVFGADFRVIGTLGQGGMAQIDVAIQSVFERQVALKHVRADRKSPATIRALLREASMIGALDHPNIVPAYALGVTEDDDPVLVLKRIHGVPWAELIADPNHPWWQARSSDQSHHHLEIFLGVCNAIESAHRHGILHLDIKPDNVMVGNLGEVYVLDWGIAVRCGAARSQELAGTPAFMAPEMLTADGVLSVATDVYLLGATLHAALTGRPRHAGASLAATFASAQLSEPQIYPPDIPADLAAICNRATARQAVVRFSSALEVRNAIEDYRQHRASLDLCAEGVRAAAALHATVQDLALDVQRAGVEREGLVDAARSHWAQADAALRQALVLWQGNAPARQAQQSGLRDIVDLELAERNAHGAATALARIEPADAARAGQLADLTRSLAEDAAASHQLREVLHEADIGRGARGRIVYVVLLAATILGGCITLAMAGVILTHAMLFWIFAFVAATALVKRARNRSAAGRTFADRRYDQSALNMAILGTAIVGFGWARGAGIDQVVIETYAAAAFFLMGASEVDRGAAWYALGPALAVAISWLWPGHGLYAISANLMGWMAVALLLRRTDRPGANTAAKVAFVRANQADTSRGSTKGGRRE